MLYIGIDIAGAENTWICSIRQESRKLFVEELTNKYKSILEMTNFLKSKHFTICSIDAPLTYPINEANGFRRSDRELKELLNNKNIVSSSNSLMAVPLRAGYLLKMFESNGIERFYETHPRASAYLLKTNRDDLFDKYKKKGFDHFDEIAKLIEIILHNTGYELKLEGLPNKHDAVDSLLCAISSFCIKSKAFNVRFLNHDDNERSFTHYRPRFFIIERYAT
jgi:predicted nuclease with RNAse H fold